MAMLGAYPIFNTDPSDSDPHSVDEIIWNLNTYIFSMLMLIQSYYIILPSGYLT